jgi:1-acyl-sn-glycerol-3-phosphate acyltransferase
MMKNERTPGRKASSHEPSHPLPPTQEEEFVLPDDMRLDTKTFGRYMGLVEMLGRRTGLKVNVSKQVPNAITDGDIFLFNHFTHFETVITPYILFQQTGQMARSVAYAGLFELNPTMTRVLHQSGGIPNNLPRLLPFLAEEILRGRKVIIFPEAGLVKDKQVLDAQGNLKMWSGEAGKVRKPHRGAAVLALMLDLTKRRIRTLFAQEDTVALAHWCARLDISLEALKVAVEKPTLIVPSNITFYPMRTNPNMLVRTMEKLVDRPPAGAKDDLTVEGNFLLRPTDMHVRFGEPVSPLNGVKRLQNALLDYALANTRSTDDVFALKEETQDGIISGPVSHYVANFVAKQVDHIREDYSRRIYLGTTININTGTDFDRAEPLGDWQAGLP